MQTVTATLERILYRKGEPEGNGWGIYKTNLGAAKGVIPWEPEIGAILKLEGEFKTSDFNGQNEFVFKSCYPALPEDSRALLTYAVSITNGIGPKVEQKIWERYGESWREVKELDIPGITETAKWNWTDALDRLESEKLRSETFGWLLSMGCSMNMATAAWKLWGEQAFGRVSENCYALADLPRYSFNDVDKAIRKKFKIVDKDPRRIDAAIIYVLKNRITDGSTWVRRERVQAELLTLVADVMELFDPALDRLIAAEKVVKTTDADGEQGYSLFEDAENERIIAERFKGI